MMFRLPSRETQAGRQPVFGFGSEARTAPHRTGLKSNRSVRSAFAVASAHARDRGTASSRDARKDRHSIAPFSYFPPLFPLLSMSMACRVGQAGRQQGSEISKSILVDQFHWT